MKRNKLQLKKTTIRALLDRALTQVAGGATAAACTGGTPTLFCSIDPCDTVSPITDRDSQCTWIDTHPVDATVLAP
jgi:hypothetical protein